MKGIRRTRPGALRADRPAQAEHHQALVLADDPQRLRQDDRPAAGARRRRRSPAGSRRPPFRGCRPAAGAGSSAGSTFSLSPSIATTRTRSPRAGRSPDGLGRPLLGCHLDDADRTRDRGRTMPSTPDEGLVPRDDLPVPQLHAPSARRRGRRRRRTPRPGRSRAARRGRPAPRSRTGTTRRAGRDHAGDRRRRRRPDARARGRRTRSRRSSNATPISCTGQHPERDERRDEHDAAGRPGDPARDEELDRDERQPEPEEEEREVRVQQRVQEARRTRRVPRSRIVAPATSSVTCSPPATVTVVAVDLCEQRRRRRGRSGRSRRARAPPRPRRSPRRERRSRPTRRCGPGARRWRRWTRRRRSPPSPTRSRRRGRRAGRRRRSSPGAIAATRAREQDEGPGRGGARALGRHVADDRERGRSGSPA